MRVTVCQLSDDAKAFEADWDALCVHVEREQGELVLLPEMPFAPWFATARAFDAHAWSDALAAHARWKKRLQDMAPAVVLSTEPVERSATCCTTPSTGATSSVSSCMRVALFMFSVASDRSCRALTSSWL